MHKEILTKEQLGLLKTAVTEWPDFEIDETDWTKIKPALKKARAQTYKEVYG